jgi:glyoxylase-like metal-dependent hydrolase (beta-lactamase superfamily II)
MKKFILSVIFAIGLNAIACAQPEIVPQKVAENLYVVSGMGGNISFLITSEGVIVVDAGNLPRDGAKVVSLVSEITNQPIKFLVYTHCHGDHVGGAAGLPENITIIGHTKIVDNLKNFNEVSIKNNIEKAYPERIAKLKGDIDNFSGTDSTELVKLNDQYNRTLLQFEEYKKIKIRYPKVTFDDLYTLNLGEQKVDLLFKGAGHTNDNIVVVYRNYNIIHAADLVFNGMVPFLFVAHGGTPSGWQRVVQGLYSENFVTVIPGHGAVGGNELLKTQSDYFARLTADVKKLKDEGKSIDEIKASLNAAMYGLKGNEHQFPINVEAVFGEL